MIIVYLWKYVLFIGNENTYFYLHFVQKCKNDIRNVLIPKGRGGQGSLARVIIFTALFLYPPFLEDGLKFTKTNAQCSGSVAV